MPERTYYKRKLHIVGAGNVGGVKTYALNIAMDNPNTIIYNYDDYKSFWHELSKGDVVFLNVIKPSLPFLTMIYLKGRRHFRVIFCSHGLSYLRVKGLRRYIVRILIRFVSKTSDSVIVLNQCDLSLFKCWNKSSYCIPTVLKPLLKLKQASSQLDFKSGLKWVMVGRLDENKNPKEFINIAKSVLAEFPSDQFIWIGQGPLFEEIKQITRNNKGINFIGSLSNEEVRDYLEFSDIYLSTSRFEVLPITLLEAAASNMILMVKKYHYSDDIAKRFNSCIIYENQKKVVGLRRNISLLNQKKEAANKIYLNKDSHYDLYMKQMNELLYG